MRPTWTEIMDMDWPTAAAVLQHLPGLSDGAGDAIRGLLIAMSGRQ